VVFIDASSNRVFKITRGFGLTVDTDFIVGKKSQRWLGVPFVREATPLEYLERTLLFNQVFADEIRLEAVIQDANETAIVISQPVVRGRETTHPEIAVFMALLGFVLVGGVIAGRRDSASFFRETDGAAVFDTHGENFLTDGLRVAPIDALIIRADDDLRAFLRMPAAERRAEVGLWTSLVHQL